MINVITLICCFTLSSLFAETTNIDAVHAKVASKVYFTSDFINLQKAISLRICELRGQDPNFLTLVKSYYKDKGIETKVTSSTLGNEKLSFKKQELDVLIIIVKLIQVLVEQQVSAPKSHTAAISSECLNIVSASGSTQIQDWRSKLIFLDDLLEIKASIEKDQNKKQIALKSILDSLDKQLKHEVMIKLE